MDLYSRNLIEKGLLPEEEKLLSVATEESKISNYFTRPIPYHKLPQACMQQQELFPNNCLYGSMFWNKGQMKERNKAFETLVCNKNVNERDVLNFINERDGGYHYIIGSILCEYPRVGHHDAFLFPEFKIGTDFKADYLLVASGSGGYEFVFVELESVYGRGNSKVTIDTGELGAVFNKGLSQVRDWKMKINSDFSCIKEVLKPKKHKDKHWPDSFLEYDPARFHYAVVAGRRCIFTEKTYSRRRELFKENDILLLHYDNLIDRAKHLETANSYSQ